jgi:membrane protein YqaA with SNARE-associated domain
MSGAPVIFASFLACALSGFVPLVNGEAVVVSAAVLVGRTHAALLVIACACGQMLSKVGLYGLARWSPSRLPPRARRLLVRAEKLPHVQGHAAVILLASAGIGVPPFYLVTLAAGAIRVRLELFAALGLTGTLVRYALLAWGAARLSVGAGFLLP